MRPLNATTPHDDAPEREFLAVARTEVEPERGAEQPREDERDDQAADADGEQMAITQHLAKPREAGAGREARNGDRPASRGDVPSDARQRGDRREERQCGSMPDRLDEQPAGQRPAECAQAGDAAVPPDEPAAVVVRRLVQHGPLPSEAEHGPADTPGNAGHEQHPERGHPAIDRGDQHRAGHRRRERRTPAEAMEDHGGKRVRGQPYQAVCAQQHADECDGQRPTLRTRRHHGVEHLVAQQRGCHGARGGQDWARHEVR